MKNDPLVFLNKSWAHACCKSEHKNPNGKVLTRIPRTLTGNSLKLLHSRVWQIHSRVFALPNVSISKGLWITCNFGKSLQKHHQTVGKHLLALQGQQPTPFVKLSCYLSHVAQSFVIGHLDQRWPHFSKELIRVFKSSLVKVKVSKVQHLTKKAYWGYTHIKNS